MIDFRHETFLNLCRIKNYTKTAEALHITQPAVSQHIKYLEELYGGKLFSYKNKTLTLTVKGERLFDYTRRMSADFEQIKGKILSAGKQRIITFGSTLTIGEFIMPEILLKVMKQDNNLHLNMLVENTKTLIEKLYTGEVAFVLLEGFFDKTEFGYRLFKKEEFIALCSPKSQLKKGTYNMEDLLKYHLVLREIGSGTRDILEQELYKKNFNISSFKNVIEIGNMNAIKELVMENAGITFMYKVAAQKEISEGKLCRISVNNFTVIREFNFVYLKESILENEYIQWLKLFNNIYEENNCPRRS